MNVTYTITEYNAVQVLSINSLRDEWQNRQILKELQHKIDKGTNEFVIDLAQLNLMNSIGLNFLLSLFSKTRKTGGSLILANASQKIQRVLEVTKLSNVFNVQPTVKHAVDSFSMDLVPA